jgi:hypothetical protein
MASTYSPLLRVELIGIGDQANTWGLINNTNLGTVLEQAIAGTAVIDVTIANQTLSQEDGTSDQARCMIIRAIGTPGTSRNIVAPKLSKMYIVSNESNANVVFKGSDTTGVTLSSGTRTILIYNGTDFVTLSSAIVDIVSGTTGTLTVPRGGTGTANGSITGTTALTFTAGGSDEDVSLIPSGSGSAKDNKGKLRAIPQSGAAKTTGYTLLAGDTGQFIQVGSGGSITIPDGVFSAGDTVGIANNTSGTVSITCSITTAYLAGVDVGQASLTLATRGIATVLFLSGTSCIVTGNVS